MDCKGNTAMKKTFIALAVSSLVFSLTACGGNQKEAAPKQEPAQVQQQQASEAGLKPTLSKEEREALNRKVMDDTFKYDAAKSCWRTDGACLKMRYDHAVLTEQGENVYLRASGPVKAGYSDATLHSLIVYQPMPDGYQIIDSKKVRTFTYGHNADGKYPFNRFFQFGPDSYGWMLVGLEHESDGPATLATLYGLDKGHLKSLGAVSVAYDDSESSLKCTVGVNTKGTANAGYYPLTFTVTGTQNGKTIKTKVITLPFSQSQQQYDLPDGFICGN